MTDYTDEIIQKYREVKDGIKVSVDGLRNGSAERLSIEVPSERGHFKLPSPQIEGERMHWYREKLSGALYLLWGISQDGRYSETYLCRNGCSKKIPMTYKDLNQVQFRRMKKKLKSLESEQKLVEN